MSGAAYYLPGRVKLPSSLITPFFPRIEVSKYEISVLRVVACGRKFLYTVTQQMRLHKLKLAKMTKKKANIRPGSANGRYGRTASAQKKDVQDRSFSIRFYVKKLI